MAELLQTELFYGILLSIIFAIVAIMVYRIMYVNANFKSLFG